MNTDYFHLTEFDSVLNGLREMVKALCGIDDYSAEQWVARWLEVAPALFLVEIMKRAEDKEEWFPHGRWATIQAIQGRIDEAITKHLSTQMTP